MKVLHLYSRNGRDGAGDFVLALHNALAGEQVSSRILTNTDTAEPNWTRWVREDYLRRAADFTFGYPGQCLPVDALVDADVIHLHTVQDFLTPSQIGRIIQSGKPVVWTLHDYWPMTGGCHQPGDCRKYTQTCASCPQLEADDLQVVEAAFRDRLAHFDSRLTVVAPTEAMASDAQASTLFARARVETIPSQDIKTTARRYAGLYAALVSKPALAISPGNGVPGPVEKLLPELIARAAERRLGQALADLDDEAAEARTSKRFLEVQIAALRRDLRRARRNIGYQIVHGLGRAVRPLRRVIARKRVRAIVQFPKPPRDGTLKPSSTELRDLAAFLAEVCPSVFFTSNTRGNWALHQQLLRGGSRHLCFSPAELSSALMKSFLTAPCGVEERAFANHELIVLDAAEPGLLWPLLKGRLWPHQKILFHGASDLPREFKPTQAGPDFLFYHAAPRQWLDPRHNFLPSHAPWKSTRRSLSAQLPSGKPWPKMSVVTPTFNQGKFIAETFDSILSQKYPNLEYLVLDGGSTDDTLGILRQYHSRFACCVSEKDKGQADAINKGFARASGDIFAWLNSDDQYAPDALMQVALAFDLFPEADLVVGGCGLLNDGTATPSRVHHSALPLGRVTPLPLAQLLDLENCWLKGHFFYQPEVFWRRRIWEAAGARVRDDLYYCFDYDLWVKMARAGAKVVHLPDLLALYRVHPGQKTYGESLPYLPELNLIQQAYK